MRKQLLLKMLLAMGVLLLISSFSLSHFTTITDPLHGFLKGLGITLIVAYFLKASLTKTVW
jgi:hypothetical protein